MSRVRSRPALSIRARPPRIAAGGCAASRAASSTPTAFVNFLQNHDQIGNRALGDRLESTAERQRDRSRTGDYAVGADGPDAVHGRGMGLESAIPVLLRFRGRSRGGRAPRPAQGIRRRLCERMATRSSIRWIPSTFQSAMLDWESRNEQAGRQRLALVQSLLAIRRREIVPRLAGHDLSARAHASGQRFTDGRLAHGRRRDAASAGQSVGPTRSPHKQSEATGTPDLGRCEPASACRHGRCSGVWIAR